MTNEEKQLLHKVVCAMLPYGIYCLIKYKSRNKVVEECKRLEGTSFDGLECQFRSESGLEYSSDYKPYLRPMLSMTEKEIKKLVSLGKTTFCTLELGGFREIANFEQINWLNAHHFDYQGLIEKGLAIEALDWMYKIE